MSAERQARLSTSIKHKATAKIEPKTDEQVDDFNDLSDISDDFLDQFIDAKDCKSIKENSSSIELWCEQILFNTSANQTTDKELQDELLDELYKCTSQTTTTDQLSAYQNECNQLSNEQQKVDCFARDDQISLNINTSNLAASFVKQIKEEASNEYYEIEDHIYSKPPPSLSYNNNQIKIERPLNDVFKLFENATFQNLNLDLYVN